MDYGADDSPNCGYVDVIAVIANDAEYEFPGWHAGPTQVIPEMTGMDFCQAKCAMTDGCEYFAYEWEEGYHECFLKRGYSMAQSFICDAYVPWEFDDPNWHGASGPNTCISCANIAMDYGADQTAGCGYVDVVRVIANDDDYEFPAWHGDVANQIVDYGLGGMLDCQEHCYKFEGCDFFTYEFEGGYRECFLKKAYTQAQLDAGCQEYVEWGYDDEHWHGGAGPSFCCADQKSASECAAYPECAWDGAMCGDESGASGCSAITRRPDCVEP